MARSMRAFSRCRPPSALHGLTSSMRRGSSFPFLFQLHGHLDTHLGDVPTSAATPSCCAPNVRWEKPQRSLFVEMRGGDVFWWTAKISSFAKCNEGDRALLVFKSMLAQGVRPNYVTVLCIARAVGAVESEELSGEIHAFAVKLGFLKEASVLTVLIGLYSFLGDVDSVLRLFHECETKDLVLWTALVSALSKNGRFLESLNTFRSLIHDNSTLNYVSVVGALSACAGLGSLPTCRELHAYAVKNFPTETNVQNALVDTYAKCSKLNVSIAVFDWIRAKDGISWNTIMCRCADYGQPRTALRLFLKMRYCEVEPEEKVIGAVLTVCLRTEEFGFAFGLHCYVTKINFLSSSTVIGTALLRLYADANKIGSARALFDELPHKDLIAWSAMVSVYSKAAGCMPLAAVTFRRMQLANVPPNEITLVSLLEACSSVGAQRHGRSIHAHILRLGHPLNEHVASALVDFYCKIGRVREGEAVFVSLKNRDLICWSSMINGYGVNGRGEDAVSIFLEMLEEGLKPNDVVFTSLLSACSHCGLVDEGRRWFYRMEDMYGVCPTLTHYSCVVDMLSRRGNVKEACDFIDRMPVRPDARIWGTLFAGCKAAAGEIEVAEVAAARLMELDPGNSSYRVALSNLYAELGRWGDAERIRQSLEGKGSRKIAGYCTLDDH